MDTHHPTDADRNAAYAVLAELCIKRISDCGHENNVADKSTVVINLAQINAELGVTGAEYASK